MNPHATGFRLGRYLRSTRCFDIRVVIDSQSNRIQIVEKAGSVLVAVVQPCHRGEVVNAGWREAEVPSLAMAACLGCSGLRAQPVDGAVGMERQGRWLVPAPC